MVHRSPSSNFTFRHILNMAPQQTGSKNVKGKQIKRLAGKFPSGSAPPVVRQKRKVICSKCKDTHFPPTGRACQRAELATNRDSSVPNPDLSSTLANTEEQAPVTSPSLSPVRRDPETQAALDMLQQAHLIANTSPSLSPRVDPNTPAAQAQLINNLLDRFGHNTRSAPMPPPQEPPPHTNPGTSTQAAHIPHSVPQPHNPNSQIQDALELINKNLQRMSDRQDDLIDKERARTARELNTPAPVHVPDHNNHVFSNEQERWEAISNTSMGHYNQLHRAVAADNPRSAGLHLNTDQRVNERIADLGNDATARRSGGQGVYPPHYNSYNPNQYKHVNEYNLHHSQGESHPLPMKRISSGRDRTGSDNILRLAIPWPNEHCLIGVDRRQVTYDQLTHPQWQAGLMNILAMERDPLCHKNMLHHITRLSQDVADCGFRVTRGAHAAVLVALEEGRVTWTEPEAIEMIRRDAVSRVYFETEAPVRSSSTPAPASAAKGQNPGHPEDPQCL